MTDETQQFPKSEAHKLLLWAKKWATHPSVLIVARVGLGVIAAVGTSAFMYVVSIDGKANAIGNKLDAALIVQGGKFTEIDKSFDVVNAKIEAQTKLADRGREDRIMFQNQSLDGQELLNAKIDKLLAGQAVSLAADAAQNERLKAIEDRLTRSGN